MTDVVELARERRAWLAAEVAKLDDFLRMAEILTELGDDGPAPDGDLDGFVLAEGELAIDPEPDAVPAPAPEFAEEGEVDDELVLTDEVPEDTSRLDVHIGKMIRHRRWMMGMTQEQLSDLVGVKLAQIQKFEAGERHISAGLMKNIAMAMEVPLSFFLEGLDEQGAEGEDSYPDILPDK